MLFHLRQVLHLKTQLTNKRPQGFLFFFKLCYNKDGDDMLNTALKILEVIENHGYKAYLVGGFVRDYLLNLDTNDIDINTSATPKELKEIFPDSVIPKDDYGAVVVLRKNIRFEITTFRKEIAYKDNRRPIQIMYIDNLYQDLLRRDFTINAICMDKDGEIVDFLNGREDLEQHTIKTIGNSDEKFSEDALRILRAVRFATTLDFDLTEEIECAIKRNKKLLKLLSYERKREELDKIFTSKNAKKGISLLIRLNLDCELDLPSLNEVKYTDSLMAIWAILNVTDLYPFTSNEKELIQSIQEVYQFDNMNRTILYKYGLYVSSVVEEMRGQSTKEITELYNSLPIHDRKDIMVTGDDIMKALNRPEGSYLKKIFDDIEQEILYNRLENRKENILLYCTEHYKS